MHVFEYTTSFSSSHPVPMYVLYLGTSKLRQQHANKQHIYLHTYVSVYIMPDHRRCWRFLLMGGWLRHKLGAQDTCGSSAEVTQRSILFSCAISLFFSSSCFRDAPCNALLMLGICLLHTYMFTVRTSTIVLLHLSTTLCLSLVLSVQGNELNYQLWVGVRGGFPVRKGNSLLAQWGAWGRGRL